MDKQKLPTKQEIRDSIPAHCFKHSYVAAFGHVLRDSLVIATFAFLAATLLNTSGMGVVDVLGWQARGPRRRIRDVDARLVSDGRPTPTGWKKI